MAGQEDPVQREIHQDWANREYIEVITSSIKKIADFLNSFGQRASRGRRGWVGSHSGSLAMALRSFEGSFSGLVFASSFGVESAFPFSPRSSGSAGQPLWRYLVPGRARRLHCYHPRSINKSFLFPDSCDHSVHRLFFSSVAPLLPM